MSRPWKAVLIFWCGLAAFIALGALSLQFIAVLIGIFAMIAAVFSVSMIVYEMFE